MLPCDLYILHNLCKLISCHYKSHKGWWCDNSLLFLSINTEILQYCSRVKEDNDIYFLYKLQWLEKLCFFYKSLSYFEISSFCIELINLMDKIWNSKFNKHFCNHTFYRAKLTLNLWIVVHVDIQWLYKCKRNTSIFTYLTYMYEQWLVWLHIINKWFPSTCNSFSSL